MIVENIARVVVFTPGDDGRNYVLEGYWEYCIGLLAEVYQYDIMFGKKTDSKDVNVQGR